MILTIQDSLEIWRISYLHCCCFHWIVASSSTVFYSLWTFTNSSFTKHCQQNIL